MYKVPFSDCCYENNGCYENSLGGTKMKILLVEVDLVLFRTLQVENDGYCHTYHIVKRVRYIPKLLKDKKQQITMRGQNLTLSGF